MASGGIAYGPSIVGEGGLPEAVVPLPEGRSIPVNIRGGQSSPNYNIVFNMPIKALDSKDVMAQMAPIRRQLSNLVLSTMKRENHPIRRAAV